MDSSAPPEANVEARQANTMLGIGLMLCSTLAFAGMAACVKHLAGNLHPFESAFFRYLFGGVVLIPVLFRDGLTPFRTRRFPLHLLRGGVQACQGILSFVAVTLTPLAKATAVQFTAPLFTTMVAVFVLKEELNWRRVAAIAVGLLGTWIIMRPGAADFDLGALLSLFSAVFLAGNIILVKLLSRTETSVTITLYQTMLTTPIAFVAALFHWKFPTLEELFWLFVLGGLGTTAHICLAEACKVADVSALLPFDYMRLVWAGVLGFVLFMQVPDGWTVIGGTVIFISGLYLLIHERAEAKRR
jgi:drug/metabolite transporter (DMT)-like permease